MPREYTDSEVLLSTGVIIDELMSDELGSEWVYQLDEMAATQKLGEIGLIQAMYIGIVFVLLCSPLRDEVKEMIEDVLNAEESE